jgi:hypothetical protein
MRPIVIGIAATIALGLSTAAAQTPSWRPPTVMQPLKIQGGTGSTVAPIAIR